MIRSPPPAWLDKRAYITEDTNNTNIGFFNFVTYEILYAIVPTMTVIDLSTLGLRLASVRRRKARPQADDYCAMLATLQQFFSAATGGIALFGAVKRVTGRHDWDPWPPPEGPWPRSDYTLATKDTDHPVFNSLYQLHIQVVYAVNCLNAAGVGSVRLAFLFLFRKLFSHQGKPYSILITTLIALVTVFMIGNTGMAVFACGAHPEARWTNHDTAAQHCLVYNFGVNISLVILDTIVFLLPMWPLYRITSSMTKQRQRYVMAVFCLGFLSVTRYLPSNTPRSWLPIVQLLIVSLELSSPPTSL
ncbi:hypothetical protein C8035_v005053 [Colletotrichum spinosum]|uniref:Rhodopsin domain-containing protein n=1 Tax=Colletotrichum spinosum TaxID=1347390 RepID=A0A4R8QHX4_9PEZI|nr:hypothetical protein C8035_v005053 [Colletotrichum spinosum]